MKTLVAIYCLVCFAGCGPDYQFKRAEALAQQGRYLDAAVAYEKFHKKYPSHSLSPLALLKSAEIYNYKIHLPLKASSIYQTVISNYANYPEYVEAAKNGLVKSPDYFPLKNDSTWKEGDSATGGANMRAEWKVSEITAGVFVLSRKIMAANRIVATKKNYFRYDGYSIIEMPSANAPGWIFLQYPIVKNKSWRINKEGRMLSIWIDDVGLKVKVVAGNFEDCIRIAERFDDIPGVVKYNYYAPYVGWILTTVATAGREHRNSELLSYKIPE